MPVMTRTPIVLKAMTVQKAVRRLETLQKQWKRTFEKANGTTVSRTSYHKLWDRLDEINEEMTRLRAFFSLINATKNDTQ